MFKFASLRVCFCLLAGVAGAEVSQQSMVENEYLYVSCKKTALVIQFKATSFEFIKSFAFPSPVKTHEASAVTDDCWGKGQQLKLTLENGWEGVVSLFPRDPFAHVTMIAINGGDEDYTVNKLPFAEWEFDLGIDKKKLMFAGTGHMKPFSEATGSFAYSAVADPDTRNGIVAAWLTHDVGTGVLFPRGSECGLKMNAQSEFGFFRVKPGEQRSMDTLLIGYFDDARIGLETYADYVRKQYDIKLMPKRGVYCTWYHRKMTGSGASTEAALARNAAFVEKELKPFGLEVMQIDDMWQAPFPKEYSWDGRKFKKNGPTKSFCAANEEKFPSAMAPTAANFAEKGLVAGIWFMPFAGNHFNPWFDEHEIFAKNPNGTPFFSKWSGTCIDSTHPTGEAFIRERVKRIHDWGYRYFKIDGLHIGMPSYNIYVHSGYKSDEDFGRAKLYNPDMTYVQAFRKGLTVLREEAPDTFVLGCSATQNMRSFGAAFGLVDAMRVGPDNDSASKGNWKSVTAGAKFCSASYFLNQRVWYNDPDPFYVRETNPLEKARWMASWVAVTGSMNTSSTQYADLTPDRLDLLKRTLPVHNLYARPADYFERDYPRIWLVRNDRMNLIGLFNFSEMNAESHCCNMTKLGLDEKRTYEAFDYWKNEFINPIKGDLVQTLPGGTCRVLALRERKPYPQILSSSRNINQGITDILSEEWDGEDTLRGESLLVADDSYELRIIVPREGDSWKAVDVEASPSSVKATFSQDGPEVRVILSSATTEKVSYRILFESTPMESCGTEMPERYRKQEPLK